MAAVSWTQVFAAEIAAIGADRPGVVGITGAMPRLVVAIYSFQL